MKKIEYNKYTHEIIIEETNKKKIHKKTVKKFYKIFELISSIILGVMGIYVSFNSAKISQRSEDIYRKQLEITVNDRDPYFLAKSKSIDKVFQGSDYNYTRKIYTIKNEGGLITGANISEIYTYMFIKISNTETKEKHTYILYFDDIFERENEVFSSYNTKTKEFKFCKHVSEKIVDLVPQLEAGFQEYFLNSRPKIYTLEAYINSYIKMEYINYQNIEVSQSYQLIDGDGDQVSLAKMEEDIDNAYLIGTASIEEDFSGFEEGICGVFKNTIKYNNNKDALETAKRYLSTFTYSYKGLIEQLNLHDIFTYESAVYAADNCGADWNEQAVKTAENYLFFKPHSYNQLLDALTSIEKFTYDQAIYGINNCEVDWKYQAERRVQGYIQSNKSCSYNELIKLLEDEGYTHKQAVYGAEQNGYTK